MSFSTLTDAYVGFDVSGVMCYNNLNVAAKVSLQRNMTALDPTYNCVREGVPGWQTQFYSPVCRSWFIDQKASPERPIMTSLYTFSTGDRGITTC